MKKLLIIGLKDLKLVFRDRGALIFMLLAPFLLTLGLGMVSGRFSGGSSSGISNISLIIVNQDDGQLSQALVDVFNSEQLIDLVTTIQMDNPENARQQVDQDLAAAAIIIPLGFTESIIPTDPENHGQIEKIDIYINPTRSISVGIIKTIVDDFISKVEVGRVSGEVAVTQLLSYGLIQPQDAFQLAQTIGVQNAENAGTSNAINVETTTNDGGEVQFDILAYMAPGMALMFLLFTVTSGGRSLLIEQIQGTLPRILISPTNSSQILGGKIFGIFLTGASQMAILILATTLMFQIKWGDPLAIVVLVIASVFAAIGWGLLLTSILRTPGQLSAIGTALMLVFGILGGSFVNREILPDWLQTLSLITPNAWGLDGFQIIALGGGLKDILPIITGLISMGIVLFVISVILFNQRSVWKN